jgi:hypothetical protein
MKTDSFANEKVTASVTSGPGLNGRNESSAQTTSKTKGKATEKKTIKEPMEHCAIYTTNVPGGIEMEVKEKPRNDRNEIGAMSIAKAEKQPSKKIATSSNDPRYSREISQQQSTNR